MDIGKQFVRGQRPPFFFAFRPDSRKISFRPNDASEMTDRRFKSQIPFLPAVRCALLLTYGLPQRLQGHLLKVFAVMA